MTAFGLGAVSLLAMTGGGCLGHWLKRWVPVSGRDSLTQETIAIATGLVVTITSLTLSLLLYSTKTGFDTAETNLRAYAADLIVLDRSLSAYGTGAEPARALLRSYTTDALHSTWPEEFGDEAQYGPLESWALGRSLARLHEAVRQLPGASGRDQVLAAECRADVDALIRARFVLLENVRRTIPPMLLGAVVTWLAVIFVSLGVCAPRNAAILVTLAATALVASSCITLMDEMDGAFDGLIKVSSAPMRDVLANIADDGNAAAR